jgi:hypothetical protein
LNRIELQQAFRDAGVSDDLYALPGIRDVPKWSESHYILENRSDGFIVAIFERGTEIVGPRFRDEDAACRWLYGELVFESPKPRILTRSEEEQVKKSTGAIVREVVELLQHAGRTANVYTIPYMFDKGLVVDQFGEESGTYLYPDGTPYEQRSLPPSVLSGGDYRFPHNYHRYEIVRQFRVKAGITAPAFEQPGGGIQFKAEPEYFSERPALLSITWLLRNGYLRRVDSGGVGDG